MKEHSPCTAPMVALRKWAREIGVSDTTAWRWAKAGLIHPVNIYGKLYLTQQDLEQFAARANAGEFSQSPAGACATKEA
jgi:hypothetical protein